MADSAVPKPGEPGFIGPVPTKPTMLAPVATQPGASSSAGTSGEAVQVDIEVLRDFCGGGLQRMRDDLDEAKRDFDGIPIGDTLLSEADAGMDFARQHRAVFEVYGATLSGLTADLERLQTELRKQLDAYQRADDDAAEALLRLSSTMVTTGFTSDAMYRDAVSARTSNATPSYTAAQPQPVQAPAATTPAETPQPSVPTISAASAIPEAVESDLGGGFEE